MFRRRTRSPERRAQPLPPGGYSGQLLRAFQRAYSGNAWGDDTPAVAGTLAAAECAAGLLDRAISCAEIRAGGFTPMLRECPDLLGAISRGMLFNGAQAVLVEVVGGMPRLRLAARYTYLETSGEWPLVELYFHQAGSDQAPVRAPLPAVAVPKWATDPACPEYGLSPLANSVSQLGGAVVGVLAREAKSPHGYFMSGVQGQGGSDAGAEEMKDAMEAKFGTANPEPWAPSPDEFGGLFLASFSGDDYIGKSDRKRGEVARFGFEPPAEVVGLVRDAYLQTLSACGIPPALWSETLTPTRDAIRTFRVMTAQPIADKIAAELARVLEVPVALDLSPTRTSDEITGRARAVNSLVSAGVDVERALAMAGLHDDVMGGAFQPPTDTSARLGMAGRGETYDSGEARTQTMGGLRVSPLPPSGGQSQPGQQQGRGDTGKAAPQPAGAATLSKMAALSPLSSSGRVGAGAASNGHGGEMDFQVSPPPLLDQSEVRR